MKILLNKCFGGFGLTKAVFKELGIDWDGHGFMENEDMGIESNDYMAYRYDERLIAAVEKVGLKESTASLAELRIVEIPDGIDFEFDEYDGIESVHEVHASW